MLVWAKFIETIPAGNVCSPVRAMASWPNCSAWPLAVLLAVRHGSFALFSGSFCISHFALRIFVLGSRPLPRRLFQRRSPDLRHRWCRSFNSHGWATDASFLVSSSLAISVSTPSPKSGVAILWPRHFTWPICLQACTPPCKFLSTGRGVVFDGSLLSRQLFAAYFVYWWFLNSASTFARHLVCGRRLANSADAMSSSQVSQQPFVIGVVHIGFAGPVPICAVHAMMVQMQFAGPLFLL